MKSLMPYKEFKKNFPDDLSVINHYIEIRYNNKPPTCRHCGSHKVYQYKARPKFFQCNDCHQTFSIFKGTVFENTKSDFTEWYYVIHLLLNGKKGISAYQVQRMMGGTYKRSWRMLKQIRKAFSNQEVFTDINGIYEADEVYCNGGLRKENVLDPARYPQAIKAPDDEETKEILKDIRLMSLNKYKYRVGKIGKRGRGTDKNALLGIINRDTGQVYAKVFLPDSNNQKFTMERVNKTFKEVIRGSNPTVITDEFNCYNKLPELGIRRIIITHKIAFSRRGVNTNSMESFWSIIQRMIIGVYHHVSTELLQSYIDECVFRFNNRAGKIFFKEGTFDKFIGQTVLV